MEQCALFPLFCGMGFGSVRWFTHIVFVLSVRSLVRSFHCYAITSSQSRGKFTFSPTCPLFSASVTKLFILPILVGAAFVYLILVRDVITIIRILCACVCVRVCMGEMLSKNMCYEMAKFANKHDDRLQCRKLFRLLIDSWPFGVSFSSLSSIVSTTFFSHILRHFCCSFRYQEFRCVITTCSHFEENLPIEHTLLYIVIGVGFGRHPLTPSRSV